MCPTHLTFSILSFKASVKISTTPVWASSSAINVACRTSSPNTCIFEYGSASKCFCLFDWAAVYHVRDGQEMGATGAHNLTQLLDRRSSGALLIYPNPIGQNECQAQVLLTQALAPHSFKANNVATPIKAFSHHTPRPDEYEGWVRAHCVACE